MNAHEEYDMSRMINKEISVGLVNVVLDGDYQYEQEIPLGMAHLGAFLREQGYPVVFRQCFAAKGEEQMDSAARLTADVYGFQLNMVNYHYVRQVVEKIKARDPMAVIVLGGPFLASLAEDILRDEPVYDYIIVGEGEFTFVELLEAINAGREDVSDIKGLVWRDNGTVKKNDLRPLVEDLDSLPFPARDFLETAERDPLNGILMESVRMVSSRGCVGQCSFCCVNLYNKIQKGRAWRGRSPKRVVDELEYLVNTYHARVFNFSDSSFEDPGRLGKERSRAICEEIIRRKLPVSLKIYLRCESMKNSEDIELLKLYKRAGIDIIIPGVESGNGTELDLYEKKASTEDNRRTAVILRELDLFFVFPGFIMFGPNSTLETIRANVEFLHEFDYIHNLMTAANVLSIFRDSRLYNILKAEGRVIEPEHCWELPKYKMADPLAARLSRHWQNSLVRFPSTSPVNKLQVNMGNLVYRMTNPMHVEKLGALRDDYYEFKAGYVQMNKEFGKIQYDYFRRTISLVEQDCSDEMLSRSAEDFFVKTYDRYLVKYSALYDGFLSKIINAGYGLGGLTFKHFTSAITIENTERLDSAEVH